MSGAKIGVTVVHPGGVATSIAKSARLPAGAPVEEVQQRLKQVDKLLRMPPSQAGEQIVRAVEQRRDRLIVGADAKITSVLERIAPVGYWSLLKRLLPTT
jgi:short-subunit dehydrogenase